jgi:hypothetical protein
MLALSLVLVGCGKPSEEGGGAASGEKGGGAKKTESAKGKAKAELIPVKGEYKATLKGRVTLKGNPPDLAKLNADIRKLIDEKPAEKAVCLAGRPEEINEQSYKIGENKNVANVFVWIEPVERNQFFEVSHPPLFGLVP